MEAKKVDFASTPDALLKVSAPKMPTKNTETVAARMGGTLPASAATTGGVK